MDPVPLNHLSTQTKVNLGILKPAVLSTLSFPPLVTYPIITLLLLFLFRQYGTWFHLSPTLVAVASILSLAPLPQTIQS